MYSSASEEKLYIFPVSSAPIQSPQIVELFGGRAVLLAQVGAPPSRIP